MPTKIVVDVSKPRSDPTRVREVPLSSEELADVAARREAAAVAERRRARSERIAELKDEILTRMAADIPVPVSMRSELKSLLEAEEADAPRP